MRLLCFLFCWGNDVGDFALNAKGDTTERVFISLRRNMSVCKLIAFLQRAGALVSVHRARCTWERRHALSR
jgi:hypothetical protein